MPFVLAITIELVPQLEEEWLSRWAELAQHVLESEPSAISYELLKIEDKESTYFVYERFALAGNSNSGHQDSPALSTML